MNVRERTKDVAFSRFVSRLACFYKATVPAFTSAFERVSFAKEAVVKPKFRKMLR
jgi:hypothetical protein